MSADVAEWLVDSNEALSIELVRTPADSAALHDEERRALEPFHPAFTYPIFGEEEKIFGYKALEVKLSFASGSLKTLLDISYDARLDPTALTPPDDVEAALYKFIPPDYTKSDDAFRDTVQADAASFRPLGEKLGSYVRRASPETKGKGKGKTTAKGKGNGMPAVNGKDGEAEELSEDSEDAVVFETYRATWETPGFKEYHRRMQLFILLYIEGGSYEDEDAWEFIVLYERRRRPGTEIFTYHFVGYTSVYPFWCYPDSVRLRLSQFVILPPYQGHGHGSQLYSTLFQHMLARPEVAELTVEDPSEAFDELRDRNDLKYLVKAGIMDDPGFLEGVGSGLRGERAKWELQVRKKHKIAQRQFDRLLEMLLLKQLDRNDPAKVKAYRIQVKARLYRFNYVSMFQSTPEERKEGLARTYDSVVEDYDRILAMTFG